MIYKNISFELSLQWNHDEYREIRINCSYTRLKTKPLCVINRAFSKAFVPFTPIQIIHCAQITKCYSFIIIERLRRSIDRSRHEWNLKRMRCISILLHSPSNRMENSLHYINEHWIFVVSSFLLYYKMHAGQRLDLTMKQLLHVWDSISVVPVTTAIARIFDYAFELLIKITETMESWSGMNGSSRYESTVRCWAQKKVHEKCEQLSL